MTPAELADLKLSLYHDAVRAGLVRDAFRMARALCTSLGCEGVYGLHHRGNLTVTLSELRPYPYVTVRYKGVLVLCTMRGNWLYLPGPWEDHFRELVAKADAATPPRTRRLLRPRPPA